MRAKINSGCVFPEVSKVKKMGNDAEPNADLEDKAEAMLKELISLAGEDARNRKRQAMARHF